MDNVLTAKEGYIYTNGDTYAYTVRLGINDSAENWYEITEEEYQEIINNEDVPTEATEEDYKNALNELGVDTNA